ncbi:MAG: hypothetical protein CMK36_07795 [Porticoccaceae bacterium]|jgi:hypothetical protein|nr:hypothetical protein [Porticoccaceae bacterium]|tara:strand:+ start:1616 stop:2578 length:963 start_codon:yes stop_codon:yes gene_type:complete
MAIDYNQDIAPLRQQYFPMLAGERAFDQTMRYRQEVVLPMQQQTMKLMQQQQSMDVQDLSFRRQQFEFDQAKKRAEAQNEALAMRPVVADKINSIFEDDTIDTNEKFVELGKISMSVAPYMTAGSSLNQLFSSAGDVLKAQSFSEKQRKEEQLFEEKRQKELEARELSLVEAASKIGEFDMAKEIAERSGEVSTAEEIMMKAGKQAQEQTLGLARQKASEEATKSYISNLKSFQTSLGQLKFDQSTQAKVDGQEPKLDAASKSRLKSSLRFLLSNFPSPDKFIEGRSDEDLLKLANDLIANKLAQYSPEPVIGLQSAFGE